MIWPNYEFEFNARVKQYGYISHPGVYELLEPAIINAPNYARFDMKKGDKIHIYDVSKVDEKTVYLRMCAGAYFRAMPWKVKLIRKLDSRINKRDGNIVFGWIHPKDRDRLYYKCPCCV